METKFKKGDVVKHKEEKTIILITNDVIFSGVVLSSITYDVGEVITPHHTNFELYDSKIDVCKILNIKPSKEKEDFLKDVFNQLNIEYKNKLISIFPEIDFNDILYKRGTILTFYDNLTKDVKDVMVTEDINKTDKYFEGVVINCTIKNLIGEYHTAWILSSFKLKE
jgi:hypothetical protein